MTFLAQPAAPALLPPASLEAEQALLGALLANNKAVDRVLFLEAKHFADTIHGRIYTAIRAKVDAGRVADLVTLRQEFENSGELKEAGGVGYLSQLVMSMVSIVGVPDYARQIVDLWQRRESIEVLTTALERFYRTESAALAEAEPMDASQILGALDEALAEIGRDGASGQDVRASSDVAGEVMKGFYVAAERKGGLAGVTTGYSGLDRMTGGFMPGQLILLGARPAMGKTAISLGIAMRAAAAGTKVLYISAEMDAWQVQARAIAAVAGLPVTAVLRAGMEDESGNWRMLDAKGPEANRIGAAARLVGQLPIVWDDSPVITVAGIRAKARMAKRRGGVGLVVVDYLGRLKPSAAARGFKNRVVEVGDLARGLKELAREGKVPVFLLSQLSREVEKRDDKRPVLSDLRDSGEIEQEADVVMFLYRDHYYAQNERPKRQAREKGEAYDERLNEWLNRVEDSKGKAEVIIAKQRQGRVGPVRLRFQDDQTWFFNETGGEPAVPGLPE